MKSLYVTIPSMACPFFDPAARVDGAWAGPGRYPLGALHSGICRARPSEPVLPDPEILREYCNFGYARGQCRDFPEDGAPDAVRFGIAGEHAGLIRIHYVAERDHHPFAYALLEYDSASGQVITPTEQELTLNQARTYIGHYLSVKRLR
jgi:hypothetical protein